MAMTDKELAVIKALTGGLLSLEEAEILYDMDVRDLMVKNELDYVQAEKVKAWVEQEMYRHRAQHLMTPVEDYDLSSLPQHRLPQGDFVLPLKESREALKRRIRKVIKKHTK